MEFFFQEVPKTICFHVRIILFAAGDLSVCPGRNGWRKTEERCSYEEVERRRDREEEKDEEGDDAEEDA